MKYLLGLVATLAGTASAFAQSLPPVPPMSGTPSSPAAAPAVATSAPLPAAPPIAIASARYRKVSPSPAEPRVRAANRNATREPVSQAFVNAVQVYPFSEGVLYRLLAAPERVTDIALQAGETVVSVAAGDTVRWTVGDTTSGTGENKRVHILVKPFAAGLSTNLVIMTDRRTYHLTLESTSATAMAGLSWTYPQDELLAIRRRQAEARAGAPVASGLAVERLNFSYRISGDDPAWRPLRAFDDGQQTFIEFPPSIAVGEAPPLFVLGDKGDAQLVNYRMAGRYYVVHRLFGAAELRLGGRKQSVVRITRSAPRLRRGSAS